MGILIFRNYIKGWMNCVPSYSDTHQKPRNLRTQCSRRYWASTIMWVNPFLKPPETKKPKPNWFPSRWVVCCKCTRKSRTQRRIWLRQVGWYDVLNFLKWFLDFPEMIPETSWNWIIYFLISEQIVSDDRAPVDEPELDLLGELQPSKPASSRESPYRSKGEHARHIDLASQITAPTDDDPFIGFGSTVVCIFITIHKMTHLIFYRCNI